MACQMCFTVLPALLGLLLALLVLLCDSYSKQMKLLHSSADANSFAQPAKPTGLCSAEHRRNG
jgi:hypothetical protein